MTIFNKIGNFFNKSGNTVGKVMTATGATAMGVAGMGMMWHAMNSNNSIFGGCGCMGMGGMNPYGMGGFGMPGMSPFGMGGMGPFGMPGFGMGGISPFGMGGYNMGGCSVFGGMNPMFGMQQAFASGQQFVSSGNYQNNPWGLLNGSYNFNTTSTTTSTKIDLDEQKRVDEQGYKTAKLGEEGDKAKGKEFDEKLDELGNGDRTDIELDGAESDYKEAISTAGKNYIKGTDGNNDGLISEDEFVKHELHGKFKNVDNADDIAKVAFRKIDQNRDGFIDWKEMGAVIATFDASGTKDGKITASEFNTQSEQMTKHKDLKFDNAVKDKYNKYFKEEES